MSLALSSTSKDAGFACILLNGDNFAVKPILLL